MINYDFEIVFYTDRIFENNYIYFANIFTSERRNILNFLFRIFEANSNFVVSWYENIKVAKAKDGCCKAVRQVINEREIELTFLMRESYLPARTREL